MVAGTCTRAQRRVHAERVVRVASSLTAKTIVAKIMDGRDRTGVLIGVVDEDTTEAMRLHKALIDLCARERLEVDVIVVAGTDG